MATRRTRIVATIGPASANEESLRAMLRSGLDVARVNFSHGTHETQAQTIEFASPVGGLGRR